MIKDKVSLGLKRGTVQVVPYQEEWIHVYNVMAKKLRTLLKDDIERSIKGMVSKPIIDIVVAVAHFNKMEHIRYILKQNNYEDRGEKIGGYLFVKRERGLTTHHLHFVLNSSKKWRDYISFRDKLNAEDILHGQYSELKIKLAHDYPKDRGAYTASKNKFIRKVLQIIEDEHNIENFS